MRMVSKLHDYYDGVIRNTASDKTHTFVREQKEIEKIDLDIPSPKDYQTNNYDYNVSYHVVGFCGVLYPCVKVRTEPIEQRYMGKEKYDFYYTWEDAKANLPFEKMRVNYRKRLFFETDVEKNMKNWLDKGQGKYRWYGQTTYDLQNDTHLKELFLDQRVAYFDVSYDKGERKSIVTAYPLLKDIGFYKVFDSYSCFQKLEHFLTNEIVKPDEIAQHIQDSITDELKAHSHGFDKWSFRKEPTKKK